MQGSTTGAFMADGCRAERSYEPVASHHREETSALETPLLIFHQKSTLDIMLSDICFASDS